MYFGGEDGRLVTLWPSCIAETPQIHTCVTTSKASFQLSFWASFQPDGHSDGISTSTLFHPYKGYLTQLLLEAYYY